MISNPAAKPELGFEQFQLVRTSTNPLNIFLGSAAVVVHKGQTFVSCDEFGSGSTSSSSGVTHIDVYNEGTGLYESRASINGMFWMRFLDFDPDVLYGWGTSKENGSIVIGKSLDSGASWTLATLFVGAYGMAPTSFALVGDELLVTAERINTGAPVGTVNTGRPIGVSVYRININDDLLDPANYTVSNEITYDNAWFGGFEILEFGVIYYQGEVHLFGRTLYREAMPHLTYNLATNTLTRQVSILCPWGWCKSSVLVDPLSGHILVAGSERHPPHAGGGSVDEDRTWLRLWRTNDLFQTYEEVLDFFDFGEPYWRTKGGQYPTLHFNRELPSQMLVGLRVGIFSNSPHNSNETRCGVFNNYSNSLGL